MVLGCPIQGPQRGAGGHISTAVISPSPAQLGAPSHSGARPHLI